MWEFSKTIKISGECQSFLDAVDIWVNKPHVVNRHLCGAKLLWQLHIQEYTTDNLKEQISVQPVDEGEIEIIKKFTEQLLEQRTLEIKLCMRDLLPKSIDKYSTLRELVVIDVTNYDAFFMVFGICQPTGGMIKIKDHRGYRIQLGKTKTNILLYVKGIQEDEIQSQLGYTLPWLENTLLTKIASWSVSSQLNTAITSLKLVPIDRYNQLYHELKKKYGIPLVKVWPEKTDPQKFVYEDVAIATYLMLLWADDRKKKRTKKKQSFVDLGCGNGLLVYILTSEGHPGLGLDLRRRKIWDFFGEKYNLQEQEITPSCETLFPEYDWLLGNHSDELTPWIPVIAARSSFHCCYFVLPCCPHDFSAKFNQKASGVSQYRAYLDFVHEVGIVCGFQVEEDTLRIPSTKRVCFIGRQRTYKLENEVDVDLKRKHYIEYRCSLASVKDSTICAEDSTSQVKDDQLISGENHGHSSEQSSQNIMTSSRRKWAANFQPRDSIQRPRNCVTVPSAIKDHITEAVFKKLLSMEESDTVQLSDGRMWNKGGTLPLSDVANLFDYSTMQKLKNECGGMQTLLRNSHHIFRVQGGRVQLRDWTTDDYNQHQARKRQRKGKRLDDQTKHIKTKLCYFHDFHPQGCPLEMHLCKFAHGQEDLRTKVTTLMT